MVYYNKKDSRKYWLGNKIDYRQVQILYDIYTKNIKIMVCTGMNGYNKISYIYDYN